MEERKRQQLDAKLASFQNGSVKLNSSFSSSLDENVALIKKLFGSTSDLLVRNFNFGVRQEIRVALVYIDGLSDTNSINGDILKPFLYRSLSDDQAPLLPDCAYPAIRDWLITLGREPFEDALRDPQRILEHADPAELDDPFDAEVGKVAVDVYHDLTGGGEVPQGTLRPHPREPGGRPFKPEVLPRRFPRLWRAFNE
jgi:hypothetical protein